MQRTLYTLAFLFISCLSHAAIDTLIGIKAPRSVAKNDQRLAHYLCDGLGSDREKVNAIYNWITHNIRYDIHSFVKGDLKHDKVPVVLRKRKGVCEGYSYLFTNMCQAVGINAVTIDGYARDWIFDDGDKLYMPRHAWNAVMIDGQWQLVDATWGAGGSIQSPGWVRRQLNKLSKNPVQSGKLRFAFHYDTSFFLQDPEAFRVMHLPTDPVWQLTDTAMPASVFEAGKSAVESFNEHSKPQQQSDLLAATAVLPEPLRTYEYADRAFAFNHNFYFPLALKQQVDAEIQLSDSMNARDPMPVRARYGKATKALEMSKEYLKKQKDGNMAEYRELKQKNRIKNTAAKKDIREVTADNKRLAAQCTLRTRSGKSRLRQIAGKETALAKMIRDTRPATGGKSKPAASNPTVMAEALDSAAARSVRIQGLIADAAAVEGRLQGSIAANKPRLDSLSDFLYLSDSLMVQATIARINMRDNYDDEIIALNGQFKAVRFATADSIQKRYQRGYDSILVHYDNRSKTEKEQLTLYKTSLRALAKYQYGMGNAGATGRYRRLSGEFSSATALYARHLADYRQAIQQHAEIFDALQKLYRRQDKLAAYMERAEKKRNDLEEETLKRKDAFNKRENTAQQKAVEKTVQRTKKMEREAI